MTYAEAYRLIITQAQPPAEAFKKMEELVERATEKDIVYGRYHTVCPTCEGEQISLGEKHCPFCGQALKW